MDSIEQLVELNPDLADKDAQIDPIILESISRLAYRHQRLGELFKSFRSKLGLPDPNEGAGFEEPENPDSIEDSGMPIDDESEDR